MKGMKRLTKKELNTVKGGFCSGDYGGYYFCCPASKKILQKNTAKYLKTNKDKAKKYIQFIYENCYVS